MSLNRPSNSFVIVEQIDQETVKVGLPEIEYFLQQQEAEAIEWMYPGKKFDADIAIKFAILASTNKRVDYWNTKIQDMNEGASTTYLSKDSFQEVDDPHNIITNMLTETAMNNYNANGIPRHEEVFKCIYYF